MSIMICNECDDLVDTDFMPFNFELNICFVCESLKDAVKKTKARELMSNANADNAPEEYQNQKTRRSVEQWDVIGEIDKKKGSEPTQNKPK